LFEELNLQGVVEERPIRQDRS